jgi:IrrE N-terminal-like domain
MREYTRVRIARLCADALRRSGALGVLPTPLEAVHELAGIELERLPVGEPLRDRLLGAVWFEERALFVRAGQSAARRRFTEAHEAVHVLCPWHAAALRVDTAEELFGSVAAAIEAEANYGAGQLIFQGDRFADEAALHDRSLRTAFALAGEYGASRHAAAHHYAESHRDAVALLVAGRWPDATGRLPVWRTVESHAFARRHGRLRAPWLDTAGGPLAEAIDAARTTDEPVEASVGGLRAEVANNRHCHLVLVTTAATARPPGRG